jgi:hypothetical protein
MVLLAAPKNLVTTDALPSAGGQRATPATALVAFLDSNMRATRAKRNRHIRLNVPVTRDDSLPQQAASLPLPPANHSCFPPLHSNLNTVP